MARNRRPKRRARARTARSEIPARPESQLARERALEALSWMRSHGLSLAHAAREAHTTPRTVRKYAGHVLLTQHRRFAARPFDRLARRLRFLTPRGITEVTVRNSRTASRIAAYWSAVDHYLKTGDASRLRPFRGKSVRFEKLGHPFVTDPRTLSRLANAGETAFEDLYALVK